MTGTAITEAEEFKKIYDLDVISIPTNKPLIRIDENDLIFKTQRSKYAAIASLVEEKHKNGQPVLIGTTSIEKNGIISTLLQKKGLPHQVLNAKNHRSEAEIIAKAGKKGSITVATNMAGRGVDIILGGPKDGVEKDKWQKEHDEVVNLGGLCVIGTERHESRRIDNQLRGRAGRQGDPGYSQFYVALDDDIMRIFGGEKISGLMGRFNMPEDVPLTHPLVSRVIEQIQVKVEGFHFDSRKNLVEYDDVINKQRQIVYKLRDQVLLNQQKNPKLNQEVVFKYLTNQVNSLVAINKSFETNQLDSQKVVLEFSEILPLNSSDRNQLQKELQKSDEPIEVLLKILNSQWQSRVGLFGDELANSILAYSVVSTLDPLWVEHLTALDDLRDGVRLRGYAQKDPLVEYRKEGYEMFQKLMAQFEYNLSRKIFRLEPVSPQTNIPQNVTEGRGDSLSDNSQQKDNNPESANMSPQNSEVPIKNESTVGRNDLCPCGSGKKYKKCCYPKFG